MAYLTTRRNWLLLLFAFCLPGSFCYAGGGINASYSEPFDDLKINTKRICLSGNGNTLVLSSDDDQQVDIRIYNAAHLLVKTTAIPKEDLGFQKLRVLIVRKVFSAGDEVVAFIEARIRNSAPRLVRVHLSPADGSVIRKEEFIVPEAYQSQEKAAHYADVAQHYIVSNDPASDAYAVACIFTESIPGAGLPYIVHYNGRHETLATYRIKPEPRYSYCEVSDIDVNGEKELLVLSTPFDNGRGERKKGASVMLSRLRPGGDSASVTAFRLVDKAPPAAWMAVNRKNGMVYLLTRYLDDRSSKSQFGPGASVIISTYVSQLQAFDPAALAQQFRSPVGTAAIEALRREDHGISGDYEGLPSGLSLGADGLPLVEIRRSQADLGLIAYNAQGAVTTARYFRPQALLPNTNSDIVVQHTKHGSYVMLNESAEGRPTPGNPRGMATPDAMYYELGSKGAAHAYLFGKGDGSFDHRYAELWGANYDEASDTYATLIVEERGSKKQARLVWLKWQ